MSKAIQNQVGDWYSLLEPILHTKEFETLTKTLKTLKEARTVIYPDTKNTFRAFKLCQLKDTKVVILGQDPYHDGSATGLAFANSATSPRISPSLKNIFKAIETDYDTFCINFDETLETWAEDGVLMLNTALTVEKGKAGSHLDMWKPFTEELITRLSSTKDDLIFVLWGKKAQEYEKLIKGDNIILKAPHPAAESYTGGRAGFYTCGHFSAINRILKHPINWFVQGDAYVELILNKKVDTPF